MMGTWAVSPHSEETEASARGEGQGRQPDRGATEEPSIAAAASFLCAPGAGRARARPGAQHASSVWLYSQHGIGVSSACSGVWALQIGAAGSPARRHLPPSSRPCSPVPRPWLAVDDCRALNLAGRRRRRRRSVRAFVTLVRACDLGTGRLRAERDASAGLSPSPASWMAFISWPPCRVMCTRDGVDWCGVCFVRAGSRGRFGEHQVWMLRL